MFEVSVTQDFAAAHRLNGYQGQCSNLHGHTWKVEVSISSNQLDENGMVIDFKDLKSALLTILKQYDHGYINDLAPFDRINPTAENIAREIHREIKAVLTDYAVTQVKVWESAGSCATYRED